MGRPRERQESGGQKVVVGCPKSGLAPFGWPSRERPVNRIRPKFSAPGWIDRAWAGKKKKNTFWGRGWGGGRVRGWRQVPTISPSELRALRPRTVDCYVLDRQLFGCWDGIIGTCVFFFKETNKTIYILYIYISAGYVPHLPLLCSEFHGRMTGILGQ